MARINIRAERLIPPVLGLISLAGHLATLSGGAFPGDSASLIVQHLGLATFATTANPIWGFLAWLLAKVPLGTAALRLNVLSAVCAAAAVALLARIVTETIFLAIEVDETNRTRARWASNLGGLTAGLFLAFCRPFWIVANRAHVATFDLLLLFCVTGVFLSMVREWATWKALAFALLYGLGIPEFATLIVLAPLFGIGLLYLLWRNARLNVGILAGMAACSALGLLVYLAAARRFMAAETYPLLELKGLLQVLYLAWRNQVVLITRSLPSVGWLLVLVVSVVPWGAVLLVGRRGLNEEKDWGYYILHLVMSAVVGAVLLNAPFAPWRLLGQYRLLVTPYALLAVCYGYLTAYWFLLPAGWWKEDEVGWRVLLRRGAGWVFAAGAVALVGVAPFRNVEETDARPAAGVNAFARRVVERAAGRTWLVTDGALDNTLLLAAAELGRPLRLLDLRLGTNPMYMKYVSRHFENPRLRSLAEAGLVPLLKEWLASEPGVEARVAVMVIPDFWLAAGMHPLPNGLVFLGVRDRASVDLGAVWEGHRRLWAEPFVADLQATRQTCPLLAPLAGYLLRHAGMVANNLGVWLEDAARTNEAFAAYGEARRLDPANVSALLNQHGMIERGHVGADAPAVESAFRELAEHPPRKYPVWSLSRYYGYVRMPQAYANLGLSWALSGQPGMAVAGIKQAIELAPEGSGQLSQFLANLYLAQGQADAGEAVFRRLLEKEPENPAALIGMGRVAALRRDFAAAAEWLGRAEKAGVPGDRMAMEWAAMHTLAGSLDKARIALQELVEVKPDFAPAWAMLADVLLQQGDRQALDECERSLERLKTQDVLVAVVRAKVALARSDLSAARRFLAQALELNSASVPVLEMMLQLDIEDVQPEMAQRHVGMLLTVDPENALGNLILASLQIRRGEYLLAENSLRRSLATRRSFEALNDLAWVLQARGNLAEAETCAREALALTSVSHSPWDTLGVILMKAGRLDESGKALQRAATLAPESLAVQTHLAELYARQGQEERAAQLADQLLAFPGELTREDRDTLSQISRRVLIAGATNVPPARPAIPRF